VKEFEFTPYTVWLLKCGKRGNGGGSGNGGGMLVCVNRIRGRRKSNHEDDLTKTPPPSPIPSRRIPSTYFYGAGALLLCLLTSPLLAPTHSPGGCPKSHG